MRARVFVPTCCDGGEPCPFDNSPCGVIAEARDARGNLIASFCMEQSNLYYPYPYELITDCIFDRWTVPHSWTIYRNGTAWKLNWARCRRGARAVELR